MTGTVTLSSEEYVALRNDSAAYKSIPDKHPKHVLLTLKEVSEMLGIARSTIYLKIKTNPESGRQGDPSFPLPIKLGSRKVAFVKNEIDTWVELCMKNSRASAEDLEVAE